MQSITVGKARILLLSGFPSDLEMGILSGEDRLSGLEDALMGGCMPAVLSQLRHDELCAWLFLVFAVWDRSNSRYFLNIYIYLCFVGQGQSAFDTIFKLCFPGQGPAVF